jgi:hypothetical protein
MTERRRRWLRLKTSYNPAPDIWNTARRPIWARAVLKKPIPGNVAFCMSAETGPDHNAVRFGHCGWWRRTWHECGARGDVPTRLTLGFGFQETAMRTGSARLENAMWIDDTLKQSDTLKGRDGTIEFSDERVMISHGHWGFH